MKIEEGEERLVRGWVVHTGYLLGCVGFFEGSWYLRGEASVLV